MKSREYIRIGRITGPHGLKGFVKAVVITDIDSRFSEGNRVFIDRNGAYEEHSVESFEFHKNRIALAKFSDMTDVDAADEYSGADICITREEIESARGELGEGEFFYSDLIGTEVFLKGLKFGTVNGLIEAGAGHILQIERKDGGEVLVPFVDEMADTSRLKEGRIDITPVDGLIEE